MSENIRKRMGPAKATLKNAIDGITQTIRDINLNENDPVTVRLAQLKRMKTRAHKELTSLEMKQEQVEKWASAWTAFYEDLPDRQQKTAEQTLIDQQADGEDGYINLLMKGSDLICEIKSHIFEVTELQTELNAEATTRDVTPPQQPPTPPVNNRRPTVHLPKITLPTFDGNKTKFAEFWELFIATVDSQDNLPTIQKFSYLKGLLKGEAEAAVGGISLAEQNYEDFKEVLVERFGKKTEAKKNLYLRLRELKVTSNKVSDIRSAIDSIDQITRQLTSAGENVEQTVIIQQVQEKFPTFIVRELVRRKDKNDEWTLKTLLSTIREIVLEEEEIAEVKRASGPSEQQHSKNRPQNQKQDQRFRTLSNQVSSEQGQRKMKKCAFCEAETHPSYKCDDVRSKEERMRRCKELKLCMRCLKPNHIAKECRMKLRPCLHCQKTHNTALCEKVPEGNANVNHSQATAERSEEYEEEIKDMGEEAKVIQNNYSCDVKNENTEVPLLLAEALVYCHKEGNQPQNMVKTTVLFDSGSQRSFITEKLAQHLKLPIESYENLGIQTFGSKKLKNQKSGRVSLTLMDKDRQKIELKTNVLPMLTNPITQHPLSEQDQDRLQKTTQKKVQDFLLKKSVRRPQILIGSDYMWSFMGPGQIELPSGLVALPTKIGHVIGGHVSNTNTTNTVFVSHCLLNVSEKEEEEIFEKYNEYPMVLNAKTKKITRSEPKTKKSSCDGNEPNLEYFWALESIGIYDDPKENDDDRALEQFNNSIRKVDDRYETGWLWTEEKPDLPDNYGLAFGRFQSLHRRLAADKSLRKAYGDIIEEQLKSGVIEKVEEGTKSETRKHYIPHHPVVKTGPSTTKVRIVYDASARKTKSDNSLNDCLLKGPSLLPELAGVLMRFQLNEIGMTADVAKAFLQIDLREDQRDVTRFLWYKNMEDPDLEKNIQIYRMKRVGFGIKSSPFLLCGTLKYHLQTYGTEIANKIKDDIYVDDLVTSVKTEEEAHELYKESKEIFGAASMNLRKWSSNNRNVNESFDEKDKNEEKQQKVLGLNWNKESDELSIRIPAMGSENDKSLTKRRVLQLVASLYDPTGIINPINLPLKNFVRKLWSKKLSWDEEVDEELKTEWSALTSEMQEEKEYVFGRKIGNIDDVGTNCDIVTFTDASKIAYAAAVYLRIQSGSTWKTRLMFSKNRLAPKQELSIPRLELMAAVLGVRATKFVLKELKFPVQSVNIFSDSKCVLYWLKTKKPQPVFVENRLKEIRGHCFDFSYVRTNENPADIASRGCKISELKNSKLWSEGPPFMKKEKSDWPVWELSSSDVENSASELNEAVPKGEESVATLTALAKTEVSSEVSTVINWSRFSSLKKLLRTMAYVLRFCKRVSHKKISYEQEKIHSLRKLLKPVKANGSITAEEMEGSRKCLEKIAQMESLSEVREAVQQKTTNPLKDQLGAVLDEDETLRCIGRMAHMRTKFATNSPVLLHRNHRLTDFIILSAHENCGHGGTEHTLAQVRKNYWIPQGRATVKKTIKQCTKCKLFKAKPFQLPQMAPLSAYRVNQAKPFEHTGIDYCGPFYVKINEEKENVKVWVAVFTCFVTRAIHLELVLDLTTIRFLAALRRFISRRGTPKTIATDNGTQFVLAKSTLEAVADFCASNEIKWTMITANAPYEGGLWERMVGMFKQIFKKIVGRKMLQLDEFQTILTECEAIINSRPLTYVGEELNEKILRPIDLLSPSSLEINTPELSDNIDSSDPEYKPRLNPQEKVIKIWQKNQILLDEFWNLWREQYLLSLRERGQKMHKQPNNTAKNKPKVGEMVLIEAPNVQRGSWKTGVVVELPKSNDGHVRKANVRVSNGKIICRPLGQLYPLEICATDGDVGEMSVSKETSTAPEQSDRRLRDRKSIKIPARFLE